MIYYIRILLSRIISILRICFYTEIMSYHPLSISQPIFKKIWRFWTPKPPSAFVPNCIVQNEQYDIVCQQ